MSFQGGIPGLGLLTSDQQQPAVSTPSATPDVPAQPQPPTSAAPTAAPTDALDQQPAADTAVSSASHASNVENLEQKLEESSLQAAVSGNGESLFAEKPDQAQAEPVKVEPQENTAVEKENQDGDISMAENAGPSTGAIGATDDAIMANGDDGMIERKPKVDPDFLEAAEANKSNPSAEWQFDPSDADSSDDSDTSSDSSSEDESDDEEYPLLDAAETARILMQEEYGDDEGGKGPAAQLRTANEVVEEKIEKPDVTVTPDMKITELGNVESIVDNMILIKANTTGEYQVLEGGSVLCKDDRTVIGAVADTLGRVQEPLYTVAFNNAGEITEAGLVKGTTLYYVDSHSTYVFTEPLKNLKGTDASNQFDEEVGDNEVEFSDDEAEAEHKRQQKMKKRALHEEKHGPRGGGKPNHQQAYTGALSYDDDGTDMYTPMKRPDNLHHQMMDQGGAPVEGQPGSYKPHRGRGKRGGRGERGGRGGGGGGGRVANTAGHAPPQQNPPQMQAPSQQAFSFVPPPPPQVNPSYPQQSPSPFQFNSPQSFAWPQSTASPVNFAQNTPQPSSNFPAGAFVNPAFFQGQQQQQQQQPQPQQPYATQAPYQPPQQAAYAPQWNPQQAADAWRMVQAMAAAQANAGGQQAQGQSPQQTQSQNQSQANSAAAIQEILRNLANQNGGAGHQ